MALIIAARRSPVASKNGIFKSLEIEELARPVIEAAITDAKICRSDIDCVILGNALGAGGNPSRLCALSAGIPETCTAITIDTQCCSGLDAIGIAASKIDSGNADVVLAGGVESYSRAPLRARLNKEQKYISYSEAKFAPFQDENSSIYDQIGTLGTNTHFSFEEQCQIAIESHRKAKKWDHPDIVSFNLAGVHHDFDTFTRFLNFETCKKANRNGGNVNPCLIANKADGAAVSVLISKKFFNENKIKNFALEIKGWHQFGGDPSKLGNVPIDFYTKTQFDTCRFDQIEWMESFANQFLLNKYSCNLPDKITNPYGGMISIGHPIGASGAILISRLYQGLKKKSFLKKGQNGLALIPSVAGLVSAICTSHYPS